METGRAMNLYILQRMEADVLGFNPEKELADLKTQAKEPSDYGIGRFSEKSIEEMLRWLQAVESAMIFLMQQEAIEPLQFHP